MSQPTLHFVSVVIRSFWKCLKKKPANGQRHIDENTRISRVMTEMGLETEGAQGIGLFIQERASMNSKMARWGRTLAAPVSGMQTTNFCKLSSCPLTFIIIA